MLPDAGHGEQAAVAAAVIATVLSRLVGTEGARVTDVRPLGTLSAGHTWTTGGMAMVTAIIATVSPWVTRSWRRAGWTGVACIAITHFATTPVASIGRPYCQRGLP